MSLFRHSAHSERGAERPEITVRRDERYPWSSRGRRIALPAIAAFAAILLQVAPAPVRAQTVTAVQDTTCAGTRSGSALGCTAGEFTVGATFTAQAGTPSFCNAGEVFTFDASLSLSGSNANRYDMGFFVGQAGNAPTAVGGVCSAAIFPTTPSPFQNFDGDTCGDYLAGGVTNPVVQSLKVVCSATTNSDLTIPYVLTYQQNSGGQVCTSAGRQGDTTVLAGDVKSTSGSKCNAGSATLQISSVPVQVGGYVDVTKQTLPDADTQPFTYTATGPAGSTVGYMIGGVLTNNHTNTATFSLTDGQTARVYMSVLTTARTLTIVEQSGGQPAHWQGDASISCAAAPGHGSPTLTTDNTTRQIQATLTATNSGATCTVTNTKRPKVTLLKNVAGRLYAADQFSVTVSGAGSTTLTNTSDVAILASATTITTTGAGTGNFSNATNPSFYATASQVLTLTDAMAAGSTSALSAYNTSLTCTNAYSGPGATTGLPSASAVSTYNLTPAPGDDITCTYTNTPKAKLTLAKTVINDQGQTAVASAWTLSATGPTTISGITGAGAVTGAIVPTGTYTLSESGPTGYVQTGLVCSGAADGNPADGLTLVAGEIVTCTFTNDDQPVGQTVVKGWALDIDADGSSTVTVGDTLRYTVTVTNTGAIALTNVTITDAMTTPGSQNCASVAPAGTCVLSGTYVVVAGDQTAGSVTNTATVTSTEIPGPVSSNTTTTTVVPPAPAALAVVKSHSGNFSAGANASYTLQVSNTGGTTVSGTTTVTDTLAAGLTYVSGTGTGWSCGAVGQLVTCTSSTSVSAYGSMAAITLTVTVGASMGTSVDNTASVANPGIGGGTPVAGNTDAATIVHADVSTSTKTVVNLGGGATADVDAGDVLEYTITIVESAGADATNVHVTDTVQAGLGSATVSTLPGGATDNTSGGTVDVTGITVPANGSVQLKFRVTVGGGFVAGDTIDNTASVDNPAGPDATPIAPTLIYEQSQVVTSGNKILYLHDTPSLDRTPPAGTPTTGVTVNAGNTQDWVLSPSIPAGQSLVITAGTVSINLVVDTTNTVSLRAQLYDGATLIGSSTVQSFYQASPASRPFPITLASDYTLAAGHALTLRVTNSANGSKNATIYEFSGTGSTISFATSTVVHVDSVLTYAAAYNSGTTATYYLHNGNAYVRAVVSDPFGGTDVGSADITITDANGSTIYGPTAMTLEATAAATRTYEYQVPIPDDGALGVWQASVTAHEGTEGTVSHTAIGTFEVRGKVTLQQTWGGGATAGDTLQLQVTGGSDAVDGSSVAPSAATAATAVATASLPVTLVQSFTVGSAGNYTVGLSCTRDADGAPVTITGSGLSRQIQMPLDSSVTCTWTDDATVPLTVVKLAVVRTDPVNGSTNPKAIPGAFVEYQVIVTNPAASAIDTDSVVVTDPMPAYVDLSVADIASLGSGPVQFVDGSPSSALSYTFSSLSSSSDDVDFSDDNGASWTYQPVPDGDGVDANVTDIRINPKGAFAGGNAQFTIKFRVRIQ
jgi:uncharacterized repeat protein (TIGR01451 family)